MGLLPIAVLIIALPATLILVAWVPCILRNSASPALLWRATMAQMLVFALTYIAVLAFGISSAYGQEPGTDEAVAEESPVERGMTSGDGLAMLGVALATGLSVAGAGYAVGIVGAAALGAIAERPELFGRTLVFIGLAEGLAIYGLIVSVLILGRIG